MLSRFGVLLLAAGTVFGGDGPSYQELLDILNIQTWRVRVPASSDYTWAFQVIPRETRMAPGPKPSNLSKKSNHLLALRGAGENKFDFVLPTSGGASSRGVLDLCEKGLDCEHYSYSWLEKPAYSANGEQCTLAEFTVGSGSEPTHFLVLVRTRSRPYEQ